ncbi:MAG TPA: hypothetical protein VJ806_11845 [Luteimonas sp.]|nr:hypothetical protein [Luteimonas sp.]
MSENWKFVLKALMYQLEYERDLPTRASRMFEMIVRDPAEAFAPPEAIRQAVDDALASATDLSAVYPQPYSDADLREVFFAELARKLHEELARSGEPAPQAGTWAPAGDEEQPGVELSAGDLLPGQAGAWWRLQPAA